MNIKNPLFILMADFCVLLGECGVKRGMDVLLRWLWEWKGLVQREGQARSPTKSECDSSNAKPYKHTDDCSTKSDWDSAEWRSRWGAVGTVKALLLYCRTPVLRMLRIEYKESDVYSNGGFLCWGVWKI